MADKGAIDNHILLKYDVDLGKRIGKGAYGIVWKGTCRRTGKSVAIKRVYDAFQNMTDSRRTFREVLFLEQITKANHDNLINLLDVLPAQNGKDMYLVFEKMESDLWRVIHGHRVKLRDMHIRAIIYQLLRAIKYIHSGGLIHADLKPSNVLLNSNCLVKVCDLGLARLANTTTGRAIVTKDDMVCTPGYRAPEMLLAPENGCTAAIDLWSTGCILAEMLSGRNLFPSEGESKILEAIVELTGMPSTEDLQTIQPTVKGMEMLSKIHVKAQKPLCELFPTAPHDALDLLCRLLAFNPVHRIDAATAMEHPYFQPFHNQASQQKDPMMAGPMTLQFDDSTWNSTVAYREFLYKYANNLQQQQDNQMIPDSKVQVKDNLVSALAA